MGFDDTMQEFWRSVRENLALLDLETTVYVSVGILAAACLVLVIISAVLCSRVSSLRRAVKDLQGTNRLRVQKLKLDSDKNHAFHNPTISPDEELSKRGYSMYQPSDEDLESGRATERQTSGQFVEELAREIDNRQHRQQVQQHNNTQQQGSTAPPFLLQAIQENKRKSRNASLANINPVASAGNGRASETNPNFIY